MSHFYVELVRKHTDMRELHVKPHGHARIARFSAKRVQFSHVSVFSDLHNVQKREIKSDTSGHCLIARMLPESNNFLA